jgi:hypothetical protein
MPMQVHYDPRTGILFGVCTGRITLAEYEVALRGIVTSSEHPPDADVLWDLRDVDYSAVDTDYVNDLIAIRGKYPQRGKAKIAVVAREDVGFGLSRMFSMFSDTLPQAVGIFRDRDAAERWLAGG